ncbi:hypothetical protein BVY01_03450 [bacterium I07]|nr:hypothetical protein BVY01_03450 [bacterium I07]
MQPNSNKNLSLMIIIFAFICGIASLSHAQIRKFAELSVPDIQAIDRNNTIIIIPGGIFEEHGPYLPVYTDGYSNEWMSWELAEDIVQKSKRTVLMYPTIPLGVGSPEDFGGHKPFSGSYTVRPSTLRAVYMDLASALGEDGFRWIFIIHLHGSPAHNRALIEAGDYFNDTFGGKMILLTAYKYSSDPKRSPIWTSDEKRENAGDIHAGASETSRILFLHPDLVHKKFRDAVPQTASISKDFVRLAEKEDWPGYFGSPRIASANAGAIIMRRKVENLSDLAIKILGGFDVSSLNHLGEAGNKSFKTLDQNLIRRSNELESKQRKWLQSRGLK